MLFRNQQILNQHLKTSFQSDHSFNLISLGVLNDPHEIAEHQAISEGDYAATAIGESVFATIILSTFKVVNLPACLLYLHISVETKSAPCKYLPKYILFIGRCQVLDRRPGFEPGLSDSKSEVLPLDDLRMVSEAGVEPA